METLTKPTKSLTTYRDGWEPPSKLTGRDPALQKKGNTLEQVHSQPGGLFGRSPTKLGNLGYTRKHICWLCSVDIVIHSWTLIQKKGGMGAG